MMTSVKRIISSILVTLSLAACTSGGGSGNIFDDPPDCYYDSLFGCGTFDIPGDSSYYGYDRFSKIAQIESRRALGFIPNFAGSWNGNLNRESSSCNFATPLKIRGTFSVQQQKKRVTARLPISALRPYPFRGSASLKGINVSSSGFISFCRFSARSKINSKNAKNGTMSVTMQVRCPFQRSCNLAYSGKVAKN